MRSGDVATYIVFWTSISKLCGEDVEDFSSSPSLFAICVVCEVIWRDSP